MPYRPRRRIPACHTTTDVRGTASLFPIAFLQLVLFVMAQSAGYSLLSTTRMDPQLLCNDWNANTDSGGPSPYLLLPYHRDRLLQAAQLHGWSVHPQELSQIMLEKHCKDALAAAGWSPDEAAPAGRSFRVTRHCSVFRAACSAHPLRTDPNPSVSCRSVFCNGGTYRSLAHRRSNDSFTLVADQLFPGSSSLRLELASSASRHRTNTVKPLHPHKDNVSRCLHHCPGAIRSSTTPDNVPS